MILKSLLVQAAAVIAMATNLAFADSDRVNIEHEIHPVTKIESWRLQNNGVEIMLMQIGSDQARGFFLARGFARKDVDYYASSCVFATVVTNHSSRPISYRLADWRYDKGDGVARKLKLKEDWLREWRARGVSASALIAFEWSQHPVGQALEPSDWNQGMTTYEIPHGSRFDLTVKWKAGKSDYIETIKDIHCAK